MGPNRIILDAYRQMYVYSLARLMLCRNDLYMKLMAGACFCFELL